MRRCSAPGENAPSKGTPGERYNHFLKLLKKFEIYFSPHFYKLEDKEGNLFYCLGSQHDFPFTSLHPDATKIIKELKYCWLEVSDDKGKKREEKQEREKKLFTRVYNKLREEVSPVNLNEWNQFLKGTANETVKKLIDTAQEKFATDISIMHPRIFCWYIDKSKYFIGKQKPTALEISLADKGIDRYINQLFKEQNKKVYVLDKEEDEYDEARFKHFVEHYLPAIKNKIERSDLKKSAEKLQLLTKALKDLDSDECKRDSRRIRGVFYYLFNVDVVSTPSEPHPRTSDIEVERRNALWKKDLKEAINEKRFQEPGLICVGLGHLHGETGLFKFFNGCGFTIKRMDDKGNFPIDMG